MLFLFGWGKNAKKIAYLGMHKCKNCNNYAHFHMYEIANNIKVYFIPVAKFNKKYIMACDTCQAGIELNDTQRIILLQESAKLPSEEEYLKLWNLIYSKVSKISEQLIHDLESNNLYDYDNFSEEQKEIYTKIRNNLTNQLQAVVDEIARSTNYPNSIILSIAEKIMDLLSP